MSKRFAEVAQRKELYHTQMHANSANALLKLLGFLEEHCLFLSFLLRAPIHGN